MSNANLILRMHRILDEYALGRLRPDEVRSAFEFCMEGLEALPYEKIGEASTLCFRLETAHMIGGDEVFICPKTVAEVLLDFRAFLMTLPTNT